MSSLAHSCFASITSRYPDWSPLYFSTVFPIFIIIKNKKSTPDDSCLPKWASSSPGWPADWSSHSTPHCTLRTPRTPTCAEVCWRKFLVHTLLIPWQSLGEDQPSSGCRWHLSISLSPLYIFLRQKLWLSFDNMKYLRLYTQHKGVKGKMSHLKTKDMRCMDDLREAPSDRCILGQAHDLASMCKNSSSLTYKHRYCHKKGCVNHLLKNTSRSSSKTPNWYGFINPYPPPLHRSRRSCVDSGALRSAVTKPYTNQSAPMFGYAVLITTFFLFFHCFVFGVDDIVMC